MKNILFIPCYNCEKQIIRTLEKVPKNIGEYFSEILIINNCSTDNTYSSVKHFLKNYRRINTSITIINNNVNYGLGGSHKIAFGYALNKKNDYICVLHGDDQTDMKKIFKIFTIKDFADYDVFLGSRFMHDSELYGYSTIRICGNIIFNIIFSIILNRKIYDLGSGLNMYNTKILNSGFYEQFPNDLTFNYMMILAHKYYNHKVKFFSILWQEQDQISNVKMLRQTISILKMLFKYMFNKRKFMNWKPENNIQNLYDYNIKKIHEL